MKKLMGLFVVSLLFLSTAAQAKTQVSFDFQADDNYSFVTSLYLRDGFLKGVGYMTSLGGKLQGVKPESNPANIQLISKEEASKVSLSLEDGLYKLDIRGLHWRAEILFQVEKGKVRLQVEPNTWGVKFNLSEPML